MITTVKPLTLEEFLQQPETKPSTEFILGQMRQKPMPQGEHSRLQYKLCVAINQIAEDIKIASAFPGLRCTFAGSLIVPDVAVFRWDRIPRQASGRVSNRFLTHPDWAIEILSPDQGQTKVLENLLFCSEQGTELGWLIAPEDESVVVVFPQQRIRVLRGEMILPALEGIPLQLSVEQIFAWLTF